MKTKRQTGAKGKADRLFSRLVRSRCRCEKCGIRRGPFQCAHVISRRYSATRCNMDNAWCLCGGCHLMTTLHPGLHMILVEETIGERRYWELYREANEFEGRMDWAAECERLSALLKEAEAA